MTPPTAQIDPQHDADGEEVSALCPAPSSPQRAANVWAAIVTTLADLPPAKPTRFQPHPAGIPWIGSTTDVVLAFLRSTPDRSCRHGEIVANVGHSNLAVDWALLYLRKVDLIDGLPGDR